MSHEWITCTCGGTHPDVLAGQHRPTAVHCRYRHAPAQEPQGRSCSGVMLGFGSRKGSGLESTFGEHAVVEARFPLEGIRVVDFSLLAAGPAASKMLADYGAEVILVESETNIAVSGAGRQTGPAGRSPINTSYFHNKFNTNKSSVTIDL
ncbi:MAG: hypothetical protein GEU73_15990, partial [Chloroflexi bacterium]|nr:hypothetical protein [Chloroflexota bacterium]